jgi:aryl-alcohol dehydrogenase-like predicted oxidoreductase
VELGVKFIDTADAYGPEVSENLIAEALYPYPEGLVIGTKGGLLRSGPDQWHADGSPKHLREALEGSLRRLRLDRIDLYQMHTVDPQVPYEESIGTLKELQQAGKIRHIGVSNVGRTQLAIARSLVEVVSVQNRYNVGDRASEPVLETCEQEGIAFIPWFPLATGRLAGTKLEEMARRKDVTPMQLGLAWLLHKSRVMLPIPGTSSVEHLEENVAAAGIDLSPQEMVELEG